MGRPAVQARCRPAPGSPGRARRQGRITRHGIQSVHGVPVHESAYGRDPVHPARTSSVADLAGGLGRPVECVPRDADGASLASLGRPGVLILDGDTQLSLNRLAALVPHPQAVLVGRLTGARHRARRPVRDGSGLATARRPRLWCPDPGGQRQSGDRCAMRPAGDGWRSRRPALVRCGASSIGAHRSPQRPVR
ncbi:MAG: four-carbon acid sugar kinase family protein [Methylobacterium sp.]